ncbi:MAG: tetratricopeptide repeat protein [Clostridiales Family XIII bacterium]|nr:tetratricopeptide repeat protein [Clostridiales Family XIII bacterium]
MTPADIDFITKTLGVAPNAGEEQIRAAYLALLPDHHPEDDPEGFRRLREAYEKALAYARRPEEEEETRDPLQRLLDDVRRRIDVEAWREAFAREDMDGLGALAQVGDRLLDLLMDDYYIPQRVWKYFDETFEWTAQEKRLKEKYPESFVDYVYSGIRFEKVVRDEFFDFTEEGADFQAFLDRYYEIDGLITGGEAEKAREVIAQCEGKVYEHPDFRLLVMRALHTAEEYAQAEALARELIALYPDDARVKYALGHALVMSEKPAEALPYFRAVLAETPDHYNARVGVVRALFDLEEYEEAKAAAVEMLLEYYFDSYVSALFHAASEKLIPVYEEKLEAAPDDQDVRYKLASCLFNEMRYVEAVALIEGVTPAPEFAAKHAELMFDGILMARGGTDPEDMEAALEIEPPKPGDPDYDRMLAYLHEWEAHETNRMRLRYAPEKYRSLGLEDEALERAEVYLAEFPGDPELLQGIAQIRKARGENELAMKAARAGLEADATHPGLLAVLAHLYDDEGSIAEAAESAEAALRSYPYIVDMYEMLTRIYRRAGDHARVLEIAEQAEEYGVESDDIALAKADALVVLNRDPDEVKAAVRQLEEIREREPDNVFALETLGDYYSNNNRAKEAFDCFDRLIALAEHPYYYLSRGWLYANFGEAFGTFSPARARADYAKAVEIDAGYAPAHYQLGFMAFHDGALEEAAEHFTRTLEVAPDFRGAHFYLTVTMTQLGRPEEAAKVAGEGLAIFSEYRDRALEDGEAEDAKTYRSIVQSLESERFNAWFRNHRYAEAIAAAEESGLLDPHLDDADWHHSEEARSEAVRRLGDIGLCYYETYDDETADRLLHMALSELPYDAELNRAAGEFYLYGPQDADIALFYYERAATVWNSFRAHVELAKAYVAAGRLRDAQKRFKMALKRGRREETAPDAPPGSPCNDYLTGECLIGLGKEKKAVPYLLRAISGATDYVDCIRRSCFEAAFALALLGLQATAFDEARKYYELVLEKAPDRRYREAARLFEVEPEGAEKG